MPAGLDTPAALPAGIRAPYAGTDTLFALLAGPGDGARPGYPSGLPCWCAAIGRTVAVQNSGRQAQKQRAPGTRWTGRVVAGEGRR
jgi:hypothetical protein